ncbi:MAG: diversity-generating retroelement protein Avd [Chloroflexi bacterium]|nr:MAG: diversity-generating retroelement protein Avd [Chloroflexota bacterium]RLC76922.1 MAG: diversity-generating retroelement protein Avd [Chloroflexota bacterium]
MRKRTKDYRPRSPLFVKTYDFLLWLIPLTLKFPKSQRFLLAERLSKIALDFYDLILDAVMSPEHQAERLDEADRLLTKMRLYIRLSYDLKCIGQGQFEHAARRVDEIGRLIGGWKRKRASEKRKQERQATTGQR